MSANEQDVPRIILATAEFPRPIRETKSKYCKISTAVAKIKIKSGR